jgi:Asp-tRNA(Asn)/Glu-tRNA(Gln) amidotransferase C subunit
MSSLPLCAARSAGRPGAAAVALTARRRASLACVSSAAPARHQSSHLPPPSWSLAELHRTAKADADGVDVTDATVLHVAKLSHLALAPGSPEFERAQRSMASVLASTRAVQRIVGAKQQQQQQHQDGGVGASSSPATAAAGAACLLPEGGLEGLSDADFEALAAARYADLRRDAVVAAAAGGGASAGEQLVKLAPRSEGGYFSVPKVVGGE